MIHFSGKGKCLQGQWLVSIESICNFPIMPQCTINKSLSKKNNFTKFFTLVANASNTLMISFFSLSLYAGDQIMPQGTFQNSLGDASRYNPWIKGYLQVLIWGGISKRGPTGLMIFNGNMDSVFYQHILTDNLVPFVKECHPGSPRLYHDNDLKHTSRDTQEWMTANGIKWWRSPESPDLKPIETSGTS